ncbi:MAG TPA: hypothetical protein VF599_07160 [Pyrinomonadaceae bacterium]|jgi:hypothetical protein
MNRKIIVGLVLVIGAFMTYLSRIPLAFERGAYWIRSYIPAGDLMAWFLFNLFYLGSLVPLGLFAFFYLRKTVKWTFHVAALAHFTTTFFLYYNFEGKRAEDVISFILFPAIIGFVSFAAGAVVFFFEYFLGKNKTAAVESRR